MKKIITNLLLFSLCLLFTACPYHSVVPISGPEVPVIPSLTGEWYSKDILLKIIRKNEFEYIVTSVNLPDKKENRHLAYLSKVNGVLFVNVRDLDPDTKMPVGDYFFYKLLTPSSDKIELAPITENVTKIFKTSDELVSFVSQNMRNSYFFETETKLSLVKK